MIFLYADVLYRAGGIETYLHALALHLRENGIEFRLAVSEQEYSPVVDELVESGVRAYRQAILPGDRWHLRKRMLNIWLRSQLSPGDVVFCVRQPMPELYLDLVRAVHARGARLAASWIFAPEFLTPPPALAASFRQAVRETDVVISVSRSAAHQFKDAYDYDGPVRVVNYHNYEFCTAPLPLPVGPPFRVGYMGRIEIEQKNLDTILQSIVLVRARRQDVEFHFYGGGPDEIEFRALVRDHGLDHCVSLHGAYDHRRDLLQIISGCHLFLYPSRFEGGPCFSLLELLQAGRFVITSPVGGIPDVYQDHSNFGLMVDPSDAMAMAGAIDHALALVAAGAVDQAAIRAHYEAKFSMSVAHEAWLQALGMAPTGELDPQASVDARTVSNFEARGTAV